MKLIKVFGKEELEKMVHDRFAIIERKINKTIYSEINKLKIEIENELIPIKIKLNDIDKIVTK